MPVLIWAPYEAMRGVRSGLTTFIGADVEGGLTSPMAGAYGAGPGGTSARATAGI